MTLKSGADLDRKIAYLTGYQSPTTAINPDGSWGHTPEYSSAWRDMERLICFLKEREVWVEIAWNPTKKHWRCFIGAGDAEGMKSAAGANAESAPLAVCIAFMKAMGEA